MRGGRSIVPAVVLIWRVSSVGAFSSGVFSLSEGVVGVAWSGVGCGSVVGSIVLRKMWRGKSESSKVKRNSAITIP